MKGDLGTPHPGILNHGLANNKYFLEKSKKKKDTNHKKQLDILDFLKIKELGSPENTIKRVKDPNRKNTYENMQRTLSNK